MTPGQLITECLDKMRDHMAAQSSNITNVIDFAYNNFLINDLRIDAVEMRMLSLMLIIWGLLVRVDSNAFHSNNAMSDKVYNKRFRASVLAIYGGFGSYILIGIIHALPNWLT